MLARVLESDFVWGFRDIFICAKAWFYLMRYTSNSKNCPYIRQNEHYFFNQIAYSVGQYCKYHVVDQKFV